MDINLSVCPQSQDVIRFLANCKDNKTLIDAQKAINQSLFDAGIGRYNKGKIYCVKGKDDEQIVYIGSTVKSLKERWSGHVSFFRQNPHSKWTKLVMENGGTEKFYIQLLEEFPCSNLAELNQREKHYIQLYDPAGNTLMSPKSSANNKHRRAEKHRPSFEKNLKENRIYGMKFKPTGKFLFIGASVKSLSQAEFDHAFYTLDYGNEYWKKLVKENGGAKQFEIEHIESYPCNSEEEVFRRLNYHTNLHDLPDDILIESEPAEVSYEWNWRNPWFQKCAKILKKEIGISDEVLQEFLKDRTRLSTRDVILLDGKLDMIELGFRQSKEKQNYFQRLNQTGKYFD